VIVADNGSIDNSVSVVKRYRSRFASLRLIDASDRPGQGHAKNLGVRAATGEAILFCDADDEVAPGWLSAMAEALVKHDFVACRIDSEKLNAPWVRQIRAASQRNGLQVLDYPPYLPHAAGCGLGVKRVLHDAVGGFDSSTSPLDDTDYCMRIQLAGSKLQFVPGAVVHYRYRNTLAGIYRQANSWAAANVLLYKKYRPVADRDLWRWRSHMWQWWYCATSFPLVFSKEGRAKWVWLLGRQVGFLRGSLSYRVPPPQVSAIDAKCKLPR
jgi:glycosyltransferase involved in cell wall biosynthesis